MLENFLHYIDQENLFSDQDAILLGVSGGLDSMVMTDLFDKAGYNVGIAHCNFSLRGNESDDDEQVVKIYAAGKKIPFYSKRFETKKYAAANGTSIQMAARDLRLNWFNEIANREGYKYIATAHHLDDQIETFFINLLRGTGIAGLHGILPKSGKLIHPLMFAGRKEISQYAEKHNLKYREDSSNSKTEYIRNKIRHKVIPELEKIKPGFSNILSTNIFQIRSVENIFRSHLKNTWHSISTKDQDLIKINIKKLKQLPELETYLFEFLSPYGFNTSDAVQIAISMDTIPGKQFYSKSHRLILDREYVLIEEIKILMNPQEEFLVNQNIYTVDIPLKLNIKTFSKTTGFQLLTEPCFAQLDADKIEFPLKIRKWQKGDNFYPLGMQGKKLVSDFFADQKFSLIQKEACWLLLSGNNILWIIGHRIDNRYKISDSTRNILEVKYSPDI